MDMTKTGIQTLKCGSIHHSADPGLRRMAKNRDGDTCPSCHNTGQTQRCARCLISNCPGGCDMCLGCDDTRKAICEACQGDGLDVETDIDCKPCKATGKVRCPDCK